MVGSEREVASVEDYCKSAGSVRSGTSGRTAGRILSCSGRGNGARELRRSVRRLSALGSERIARLERDLQAARAEAADEVARSMRERAKLQAALDAARAESARKEQALLLAEAALERNCGARAAAGAAPCEALACEKEEGLRRREDGALAALGEKLGAAEGRLQEAEILLIQERQMTASLRKQLAAALATADTDGEEELRREVLRLRSALAHAEKLRAEAERALAQAAKDSAEERQSLERQCAQLQSEAGRAWNEASMYISRIRSDLGGCSLPGAAGRGSSPSQVSGL